MLQPLEALRRELEPASVRNNDIDELTKQIVNLKIYISNNIRLQRNVFVQRYG